MKFNIQEPYTQNNQAISVLVKIAQNRQFYISALNLPIHALGWKVFHTKTAEKYEGQITP